MDRTTAVLMLVCLLPASASAFVTLRRTPPDDRAVRWSAAAHDSIGGVGLSDGIQVAIEPEFAARLARAVTGGADPTDVADIDGALAASFRAWESSVLRFDITFAGPVERGELVGSEVDLFLVPETDPVFTDNNYFGVTFTDWTRIEDRLLTNGIVSPGPALTGADIFINETILASVAPALTRDQQLAALQRLVMHEIGHALGLHHPNEFPQSNYDTDSDPLNALAIDPDDPTAALQPSPNINPDSVVSNRPGTFAALFFTTLQNDERGGRDVLYPLHAPECPGDCNADRTVGVNELVQAVGIALGRAELAECIPADRDHDARIRVDEVVAGVRGLLGGCPADRRVIERPTTMHDLAVLPLDITRGTIRFTVMPTWTADAFVPMVDLRTRRGSTSIEIVKHETSLAVTAIDMNGAIAELSVPVDDWAADERHTMTVTWTRTEITLYVDGRLLDEQGLAAPLTLFMGDLLQLGAVGNDVPLENLVVFGHP